MINNDDLFHMQTPATYTHEQLKVVIDDIESKQGFLYHQTSISALSSIINLNSLYSMGTLWGIAPGTRTSISGNNSDTNAQNGFIDYIYLTNVNRFSHPTLPRSGYKSTLYGNIVIEVKPSILLKRDFFVYPFNTGYDDNWNSECFRMYKLSDLSTLRNVFAKKQLSNEILVRRKINIEYFNKIYYLPEAKSSVEQVLNGKGIEAVEIDSGVAAMSIERPNFDIKFNLGKREVSIHSDELHYTNPLSQNQIFFIDKDSKCICEFDIKGDDLYPSGGDEVKVGTIIRANQETQKII